MEYNKTQDITITSDQIAHLFKFVKSKYVRYIDLQYELVDHLASAIEDEMAQDSKLTFEQALTLVYNRFPLTGFKKYIDSTKDNLASYWRSKILNILKSYFTFPKVLITITTFIIVITLCSNIGEFKSFKIMKITYLIGYLPCVYFFIRFYWINRQINFLFLELFFGYSIAALQFGGGIFVLINLETAYFNTYLSGSIITYMLIFNHAMLFHFPNLITEEINSKYAHLKLVID